MSIPTGNTPQSRLLAQPVNNGNESPPHLIDSLSDINLSPNAGTHFNRFLSARNSLELHRNRRQDFGVYRSLPCMLGRQNFDVLRETETEEESGPSSSVTSRFGDSSRSISGKSVDWADLHSSHGQRDLPQPVSGQGQTMSAEEPPVTQNSTESPMEVTTDITGSVSPPVISLLTKGSGKFGLQESTLSVDPFQQKFANAQRMQFLYPDLAPVFQQPIPIDTTGFPGSDISGYPLVPGSVPVGAFGQSPVGSRSEENLIDLEGHDSTAPNVINTHDGLDLSVSSNLNYQTPRAVMLETSDENHDIFGNMVEYNTISACHTPVGEYCNLPYDYYSRLSQPKSVPVYYQENQQSQVQRDEGLAYDTDDELLDSEKPAELFLRGPDDLPIPTPENVARTVSADLLPLIARTYKKDCRTWLWKSVQQRTARLAQQEIEERNGLPGLGPLATGGGGPQPGTAPVSDNPSFHFGGGFLDSMNLY